MADQNEPEVIDQPDAEVTSEVPEEPTQDDDAETFSRDYVSGIRKEAADHRAKSKTLATRLHAELVRSTGRLADPHDLSFDPAHIEDPDALNAAIDELLARKPHFAARTPQGKVGQGVKDQGAQPLNLVAHLKSLV
jgi:hypothetical protein